MNLRLYTLQQIKTKPYLDVYDGTWGLQVSVRYFET